MYGQYMKQNLGLEAGRSYASYLCSHRRSLGPNNPSGCRYHRIHHDVLEMLLDRFLKERGHAIDDLLSVDRDRAALSRLLRERAEHDGEMRSILARMKTYVGEHLDEALATGLDNSDGVVCSDTMRVIEADGLPEPDDLVDVSIVDLFDLISAHRSRTLETEVARLGAEHEALVERIALVTAPLAIEKLNARLEVIEAKMASLRAQAEPMADRWEMIQDGLRSLRERIAESEVALAVGTGRMKAQAIRGAIERVEVTYENRGRSWSKAVELRILPKIGTPQSYGEKDLAECITNQLRPNPTKTP
jgi:hypothetical protein